MPELVYTSGYPTGTTPTRPFDGRIELDNGRYINAGEGSFTGTQSTATITPTNGKKVLLLLPHPKTAGVTGLSYAVDGTTGVITFTRTDTTANGVISFFVIYA